MAPRRTKSVVGGTSRRSGGGNKKKSGVKHTAVKNIKGTSKKANQISNLKKKYKKATGTKRKTCAVKGKETKNVLIIFKSKYFCQDAIKSGLTPHMFSKRVVKTTPG